MTEIKENKLQLIIKEQGIEAADVSKMVEAFGGPFEEAGAILANFSKDEDGNLVIGKDAVKVKDINDAESMSRARELRLVLKKARNTVENNRKSLKEGIVKQGRAIDSVAKFVKEEIEPVEKYLEEQEKFAELRAAELRAVKKAERIEQLMAYTNDVSVYSMDDMTEDQFQNLLGSLKAQHEAEAKRLADEAKEKEEAAEAERKRQAEQAAENKRLKDEAAAKEQANQKKIARINQATRLGLVWDDASESYRKDDLIVSNTAILEAADDDYNDLIESIGSVIEERAEQAEKEAREKSIAEKAEREKERAKAQKLEQEKREREEADQKAADAERLKREQEEAAQRDALLAPDKDKLLALAATIQNLELPALKSKEAQAVLDKTEELIEKLSAYIRGNVKGL